MIILNNTDEIQINTGSLLTYKFIFHSSECHIVIGFHVLFGLFSVQFFSNPLGLAFRVQLFSNHQFSKPIRALGNDMLQINWSD